MPRETRDLEEVTNEDENTGNKCKTQNQRPVRLNTASKRHTMSRVRRKILTAHYELKPSEKCSFSTFWFVKVINIKIPNIKI